MGFAEVNFFPFIIIDELPSDETPSTLSQLGLDVTLKSQSDTRSLSITIKSSSKLELSKLYE